MGILEINGLEINYRTAGSGPVALLLHCSSSHSGQWAPLSEMLQTDFSVLAPDLHGYGHSAKLPRDGRPYFVHDIEIVRKLADEFGEPIHLVGHSLGGTIALQAAVKAPDLLASLTLIEPVQFSLLEECGHETQTDYHQIVSSVCSLVRLQQYRHAAQLFVDFWVAEGAFDASDNRTQEYVIRTIGRVTDDWAGTSVYAPGQLKLPDIQKINIPTQIICGGATKKAAAEIAMILARTIPDAKIDQVPGIGHLAAAHAPKEINQIIQRFLLSQLPD